MRHTPIFLCMLVPAFLVAGCGGNGNTPIGNAAATSPVAFGRSYTPPHPPPHRRNVTAAELARARNGGWTPVRAKVTWSGGADTALLMTNGTVMVHDACTSHWKALAPDKNGSYINGTWTRAASMPSNYGPLYFASAVLPDGKLIVNGGEYNFCGNPVETNLGAIYDPVANKWTAVSAPSGWSTIGDGQSTVLENGTYMLGNCCANDQALLDEASMTWTQIGAGKHDPNSEEGWTLLRSGDILTADVIAAPNSEVYVPSANMWQSAGTIPVNLVTQDEIGPQTLRPNNTVFVTGSTGLTAIYNANTGKWRKGPTFPMISGQQIDTADAPSSLLTDGSVLLAASPGVYKAPATFYVFSGKKLAGIAPPPNAVNDSSYNVRLLMLPTGQVMECDNSGDVEIYAGATTVSGGIAPQITSVPTTLAAGSTYRIKGRRFNGVSQANFYGDDVQEATNYPLVRITNNGTGHVFYARTHGHSFMGVGSYRAVSTMFDVPPGIETGKSSLVVVTNGIASTPVSVTIQ